MIHKILKFWPKGKYNGQFIQGFSFTFMLHVLYWKWRPLYFWNYGQPKLQWLCFTLKVEAKYAYFMSSQAE